MRLFFCLRFVLLVFAAAVLPACARMQTTGRVAATPLTVVRDVVDVPLVSVTNVFEFFADNTRPAKAPHAGVGWSYGGGIRPSIGYDLSYFLFKGFSWLLGGVDYVVCRSLWPNPPNGVSPWRYDNQSWGDLYFVSTRVLWGAEYPVLRETPTPQRGSPGESHR